MEIIRNVNREKGITVAAVLHDINQAVRYSDGIIVMKDGAVKARGDAKSTVTPKFIRDVFGVDAEEIKRANGESYFITDTAK
jgi:iron complex transport system ATP-binding protein